MEIKKVKDWIFGHKPQFKIIITSLNKEILVVQRIKDDVLFRTGHSYAYRNGDTMHINSFDFDMINVHFTLTVAGKANKLTIEINQLDEIYSNVDSL